jgi:hypothetical protein
MGIECTLMGIPSIKNMSFTVIVQDSTFSSRLIADIPRNLEISDTTVAAG